MIGQKKIMRVGVVLALACLSGVATADQAKPVAPAKPMAHAKPAAQAKFNVQQLAVADRALEFCRPIDADSSNKIQQQIADMTKGVSPDSLTQARSSDVYKTAYSNMDGFIGQIDPRNAKVACANTARSK